MNLNVIILAAGQGTRMRSSIPKVLHTLAGKPLLQHVVDTAVSLDAASIQVVVGHGAEQVERTIKADHLQFVLQAEQLGTGHAVAQALPALMAGGVSLILYGDVPLVQATTLQSLIDSARGGALGLLTVELSDPTGYGRILRNDRNEVTAIVEDKDATPAQRAIREVNTGILAVASDKLAVWINALDNNNAQREYYLTDIIAAAVRDGIPVQPRCSPDPDEVTGVNNRSQLAQLERAYQCNQAQRLMTAGLTLADPARFDLRGSLEMGRDVFIDINAVISGSVTLGDRVIIGPNCCLTNTVIGADTVIEANSVLEDAVIGSHCSIGPFARLRPGTRLGDQAKIGNFVETKNAVFGQGSKANHLSYIGDADLGKDVNVGAGTITCNYDGANKHQTTIGDNAFIGSNTALVAPVDIGSGATVGAGAVITAAVPAHALAVARAKQRTIKNWPRPIKKDPEG